MYRLPKDKNLAGLRRVITSRVPALTYSLGLVRFDNIAAMIAAVGAVIRDRAAAQEILTLAAVRHICSGYRAGAVTLISISFLSLPERRIPL